MPYLDLIENKTFTKLQIKQLWNDLRLRAIWFGLVNSGKRVYSIKQKKQMTLDEIVKQFAKLRAILWELGYPLKSPKDKNKNKTKRSTAILYKKAIPLIHSYLRKVKGKIKKV